MPGEARLFFDNSHLTVWVSEEDIRNWEGYEDAVRSGMPKEQILVNVAASMADPGRGDAVRVQLGELTVDPSFNSIDWESLMHPAEENRGLDQDLFENPNDFRERPPLPKGARRTAADANPTTRQASDALKIAKTLSGLLNDLAGLDQASREQIAQAAGLQQLPESIDRLYELADQLRMGGVQNLQVPQQPVAASYCGWDPERLRREAKPFVDSAARPAETVVDPAERFQAPNQKASDAHAPEADIEK